ncbi:hypothetical protein [Nocardioides taihuensis]|uniref:VCBS repeat-containing protein n=1 Tax=Nocardioides taihuensis TaxID=1835606 RepID=A0ABW0BIP2_9ACTN
MPLPTTPARRLTRPAAAAAALAGVAVALAPAAAHAAGPVPTTFTDQRSVTGESVVTSDLPGCTTGTAVDLRAGAHDHPGGGVFSAVREVRCDGGSGFVLTITARYGGGDSTGTWAVTGAYGELAGLRGRGTVEGALFDADGDGQPDGITDTYTGAVVLG